MALENPFDFNTESKYWSAIEVLVPAVAAGFWRGGYTPEDGGLTPIVAIIPIPKPDSPHAAPPAVPSDQAATPSPYADALAALYERWGIME